ncbi:MAG: hypothetical protein JO061_07100 [Acidobacteriaceae bacterium]|nr:hypothetical protein [Acidobacteriaceae bacterium]
MATKRTIPKFTSEAEEAEYWDNNRPKISRDLREAASTGEAKVLTRDRLGARPQSKTRPITIRLAESDIELAQRQAERKGLPYQTYIRSLLHESLHEHERGT